MNKLRNIRVAVRLPFVAVIAISGLVVFALVALTTLSTVRIGGERQLDIAAHKDLTADVAPPNANIMQAHMVALQIALAASAGDTAAVGELQREVDTLHANFEAAHAKWQDRFGDTQLGAGMRDLRDSGLAYFEKVDTELKPAIAAGELDGILRVEHELDQLYTAHHDIAVATGADAVETVQTIATDSQELASSRQTMLWTLLVVTLLVVGVAIWAVTRSILRPLTALRTGLVEIASGSGDSTTRLDADSKDEFGEVATAFNAFADRLADEAVAAAAAAASAQARAAEIQDAAHVAAENMNTVAVASTELSAAASEIARSAGDASRTAETAVRAADHANQLMERLADSSSRIGEVVESIRGIAAQTTMLALNATIEAARAGEAGRGFAVVASEVKDLAAETGTATTDIVGRVEAIHADTQAALTALGEVAHVITEISSSQSVIAAAVEEQAATTAEIDRSLTEAVTAVNQLAGTGNTSHTAPTNTNFTSAA